MPQYSKTTWVDGTAPAISAANLNKLEQGVFDSIRQDGSTTMSAQLVTIAGTAATPAIAPTGDSNTGIFFPAADTIAFGEGGLEAMRINSSGQVGIGTISPTALVSMHGAGQATSGAILTLRDAAATGSNTTFGAITFLSSPGTDFSIGKVSENANSALAFRNANTGAEFMRITSAGNVGIGTVSPEAKFHVTDSSASSTTVGANVIGRFQSAGSNADCVISFSNGVNSVTKFGQNAGNFVWLSDNTTERMRLTSGGYLLIGYLTSNGAYPLQVNGQIFATSSTIATSDGRYKKDIVSLDGALDIVAALNPVQFNWKEHPVHKFNTEVPTIGFIAQEVAEVLKDKAYLTSVIKKSECTWETETGETIEREVTRDVEKQVTREVEREVTEIVDGEEVTQTVTEEITETVIEQVTEIVTEPVKETHTEEFLGIAESNMIAILTKAIQELNAKVDALKAQLAK